MKCLPIVALLFLILNARADYSLAPLEKRYVLLLDLESVKLANETLTFQAGERSLALKCSKFYMQDRIYSDGICCGISKDDPQSAAARIRQVEQALEKKTKGKLLVEIGRVKDMKEFFVAYMKIFDAETEFKRYFPKKEFYDTVVLDEEIKPTTAARFEAELEMRTKVALEGLRRGL